ncbi:MULTISPECIES: Mor transcription activator family protein [unclassified Burkholderia]|uniref:Mor transcription activator family protein n=1 Tax=unclassified Burkholderia TaxID=2613784 RepID=UPI00075260C9|nr:MULTISPECIES: Mor transcription activator family protein [unclassified Burkholderia]KUY80122.1 DNA transposition protein [Burkholderia sp. RF4-BP95]KUY96162.1 DNA transposition protein [Burkholderia sp. RF7-non_BP1]KUY98546.1 DNA transposition protein [Burkholderia sp. RF7-non_BP4]
MNFQGVEHLLPDVVKTMIKLIGWPATIRLIEQLGGTNFPIAMRRSRRGEIRYEALAEIVGTDAADLLTTHFGGDVLCVPLCKVAIRELQHRSIRAEFDALTREHPANHAATQLARRHRMTERHIWRILKRSDTSESASPQAELF